MWVNVSYTILMDSEWVVSRKNGMNTKSQQNLWSPRPSVSTHAHIFMDQYRMGPPFQLAFSCLSEKWLNSMVYGRYKMI